MSLWNGLFVTKDTPADVREKIAAVAMQSVMGQRAHDHSEATGAIVYWLDAEGSAERIANDIETLARIESILAN